MHQSDFEAIERTLTLKGAEAAFDQLAGQYRKEGEYPLVFEARLMKKRHELGLPLASTFSISELPEEAQKEYEQATLEAARETGQLFLDRGEIPRAWPYFRAIGEPQPVRAALDNYQGGEDLDRVLEIAYQERVHPLRGLELILEHWGICRALTLFEQYPDPETRENGLRILVGNIYDELCGSIRRTIERNDPPAPPETATLRELIDARPWLFEGSNYYVDTSHVCSVLRHVLFAEDRELLKKGLEIAQYGGRLAPMFHFRGDPPFQNIFHDHAVYLRAVLGDDPDAAVAHFEGKIEEQDPNDFGISPQVLVELLLRLERPAQALAVARKHLLDFERHELRCPGVLELCELARDFATMKEIAAQKGDSLAYLAAQIGASVPAAKS